MLTQYRLITLTLVMAICTLGINAQADETKAVGIEDVIKTLREEADKSIKSNRWMRTKDDYAKLSKIKLQPDEVIAALSKRQDRDPAKDGYIKWQLLGFLRMSALKDKKASELMKIVQAAPNYVAPPSPNRLPKGITSAWAAVNGQKTPSQSKIKRAREAWMAYQKNVGMKITFSNYPILHYRAELVKALPRSSVVRPLFNLMDLEARVKAGQELTTDTSGVVHKKKNDKNKFSAAIIFLGVSKAKDYNKRTRAMLQNQISKTASASGIYYKSPGMGKKGFEVGPRDVETKDLNKLNEEFLISIGEKKRELKKK